MGFCAVFSAVLTVCCIVFIILSKQQDGNETAVNPFDDVCDNAWYAPHVSAAVAAGMIHGTNPEGTIFQPNLLVTRQEAFVMTANIALALPYFDAVDEQVSEKHGKKGLDRAHVILEETSALFAGGELSANDKLAFAQQMQAIFLDSKEQARKKFTPKKYRKPTEHEN